MLPDSYRLRGYSIRYFVAEDELPAVIKKVNKFVKRNPHLDFQGLDVQWQGEEIGWNAMLIYMGHSTNED